MHLNNCNKFSKILLILFLIIQIKHVIGGSGGAQIPKIPATLYTKPHSSAEKGKGIAAERKSGEISAPFKGFRQRSVRHESLQNFAVPSTLQHSTSVKHHSLESIAENRAARHGNCYHESLLLKRSPSMKQKVLNFLKTGKSRRDHDLLSETHSGPLSYEFKRNSNASESDQNLLEMLSESWISEANRRHKVSDTYSGPLDYTSGSSKLLHSISTREQNPMETHSGPLKYDFSRSSSTRSQNESETLSAPLLRSKKVREALGPFPGSAPVAQKTNQNGSETPFDPKLLRSKSTRPEQPKVSETLGPYPGFVAADQKRSQNGSETFSGPLLRSSSTRKEQHQKVPETHSGPSLLRSKTTRKQQEQKVSETLGPFPGFAEPRKSVEKLLVKPRSPTSSSSNNNSSSSSKLGPSRLGRDRERSKSQSYERTTSRRSIEHQEHNYQDYNYVPGKPNPKYGGESEKDKALDTLWPKDDNEMKKEHVMRNLSKKCNELIAESKSKSMKKPINDEYTRRRTMVRMMSKIREEESETDEPETVDNSQIKMERSDSRTFQTLEKVAHKLEDLAILQRRKSTSDLVSLPSLNHDELIRSLESELNFNSMELFQENKSSPKDVLFGQLNGALQKRQKYKEWAQPWNCALKFLGKFITNMVKPSETLELCNAWAEVATTVQKMLEAWRKLRKWQQNRAKDLLLLKHHFIVDSLEVEVGQNAEDIGHIIGILHRAHQYFFHGQGAKPQKCRILEGQKWAEQIQKFKEEKQKLKKGVQNNGGYSHL